MDTARMTRAPNAANGVSPPPPLYLWIEAVLLLCVSLVHNARSTFRMILVRCTRDWHTEASHDDLPRETTGNSETGTTLFPPQVRSAGGVRLDPRSGRIGPVDQFERRTPKRQRRQDRRVFAARRRGQPQLPAHHSCHYSCHSGRRRSAPKTRNLGAARTAITTSSFWVPAFTGMTVLACA